MCDPSSSASMAPPGSPESAPWYAQSFGPDYLARYPSRNRAEAAAVVGMIASKVVLEEREVLDLACGAGRHIAPLLAQGAKRVVGVDLSAGLLEIAAHDLEPEIAAGRVELQQGDMREIPLDDASVDLVVNFFTSFGYFESEAQDRRVLGEVARVLRPGGQFVLDFFNAPKVIAELVPQENIVVDGEALRIKRCYDEASGRLEKRGIAPDGSVVTHESVRAYTPQQLRELATAAGLTQLEQLGGYDGAPYDSATSPRIIGIYRK